MSIVKIIILVMLALILLSLAAGMVTLIKDRNKSTRTARFLTLRIVLSVIVFLFIGLSIYMGWLQPHGLIPPQS